MMQIVIKHLEIAISALGFVAVATVMAWIFGFFRKPQSMGRNNVTFFPTAGIFILYFFIQLVFVPVLFFFSLYITNGETINEIKRNLTQSQLGWLSFSMIAATAFITVVYSLVLGSKIRKTVWNSGGHRFFGKLKSAVIGVLSWLIAYPWVVIIGQVMAAIFIFYYNQPLPEIEQEMVKHLKGIEGEKALFYLTIAAVVFVVPITEELLFRGFLQNWLKQLTSVSWAVVLSSILFASLHYAQDQELANWHIVTALFVVSCFLGYVYERQKTLWAPIALHITVNGVSTAILFF